MRPTVLDQSTVIACLWSQGLSWRCFARCNALELVELLQATLVQRVWIARVLGRTGERPS